MAAAMALALLTSSCGGDTGSETTSCPPVATGFRRGNAQLWEDPGDPEYVYVVRGDVADRYLFDAAGEIVCD